MFKKAGAAAKKNLRKRADAPTPATTTSSPASADRKHPATTNDSDDDEDTSALDALRPTKKPRTGGGAAEPTLADLSKLVRASSKSTAPKSTADLHVTYASSSSTSARDDATRTIEADTRAPPARSTGGTVGRGGKPVGPQRAAAHLRVTCRFDYQPDVCKDYKQTGFCGYGDSCIYLHDRGDYKQGWQLDADWDKQQKERKAAAERAAKEADFEEEVVEEVVDEDDQLPFACFICRDPFKDPIVTKCGHYFCEACAMKRYRDKQPTCAVCAKPTMGLFKPAKDLVAKIKERDARMKQAEQEAKEARERALAEQLGDDDE
ncbi:hypothetical protein AMAG_06522 [Allomyces macrogynus ATCC 38327]|uniref:Pre-mRNA-splicing factor CWC24 n=1 Tax=Allomyces macrogynus (strain ATCC 38327) TaxID=578462 RepID=A0A0L0SGT1_ALLM3|nr:hypothetical protein AMAG_06522 [Allomyces macrogynus ATCC 38327]|eukprot:KNE61721.1 hypothetical protein AMAG_06522 [Allomyces macrogynus ATCC 38327]